MAVKPPWLQTRCNATRRRKPAGKTVIGETRRMMRRGWKNGGVHHLLTMSQPRHNLGRVVALAVMSEVGSEEMEAVVTKMAQGQQKLERIMERFLEAATEDRETIKQAISGQAKKLETVARAKETSIG
ncbi:hypothetical protein NDU88_001924 [Pleurodeles waltl]|uniref:Uncharacterized protein n=1 Tax=Pleurodeles waltl TaxID=8319 RepID=A0AAV7U9U3_PLEWA|nr:hypothetical protein NDU88_001924 [Pleurodeles waltl]